MAVASGGHPQHPHPVNQESQKREGRSDLLRDGEGVQRPLAELVGRGSQEVGRQVGGEPPPPARRVIAECRRLGQPDQRSQHDGLNESVLERGEGVTALRQNVDGTGCDREQPHHQRRHERGDHPMAALQAGDPRDQDPPLPAAQHEPVEPRPDDGDEHDRNPPMITGQLACRGRRQQLERDTADDDHDIRRGIDDDPPGQQTPIPPPARAVLRIFHGAAALSSHCPLPHTPSSASMRPDRTAFTNSWKS